MTANDVMDHMIINREYIRSELHPYVESWKNDRVLYENKDQIENYDKAFSQALIDMLHKYTPEDASYELLETVIDEDMLKMLFSVNSLYEI